ncbi:hypothetical protein LTR17_012079 [Elasticomyces elasticus]|nr:hypothetical protein LTR17_012079 [Elasticomyces elasticus]
MAKPISKRQAPTPAEEERKRRDDAIRHVHLASESRRTRSLRPKPANPAAPAVREPVAAQDAVDQAAALVDSSTKLAARMPLRQEGCSVCPYDEGGLLGMCRYSAKCTLPKMCQLMKPSQVQGCSSDCGAIHGLRPLCMSFFSRKCEEDSMHHNHNEFQNSRVRAAFDRHARNKYGVARTMPPGER